MTSTEESESEEESNCEGFVDGRIPFRKFPEQDESEEEEVEEGSR